MTSEDLNGYNGDDDLHGLPAEAGRARPRKTADAFRTISEVADDLHVPQHVLRFWETKFPQVRPLKRGGGRRYYRPEDVLLLRRVADLLYTQGYTIKGVQRLLRDGGGVFADSIPPAPPEEREAAESEALPVPVPTVKRAASPRVPDLLDFTPPLHPATALTATDEALRLRALLTETLSALEDLRRLLD
jgi:DNA-binding transcriptional MerR regulator